MTDTYFDREYIHLYLNRTDVFPDNPITGRLHMTDNLDIFTYANDRWILISAGKNE